LQAELLSRVVYAREVLQLTARNFYETPQLLNRSSCDVSSVHSSAKFAFEKKIADKDRLANINFSKFQDGEILQELEDNSRMITSVLKVHIWKSSWRNAEVNLEGMDYIIIFLKLQRSVCF
jgi:hypothetical protein